MAHWIYLILSLCLLSLQVLSHVSVDVEFEGDEFATSAMYEALQQVKRAVRRTNHKWQSDAIWDDPHTLFEFFKRPPGEESARMAFAGDVFDSALDIVQNKLDHRHGRMKRRVNATDVLSAETLSALAKFSGCIANRGPPSCPNMCLDNMYRTYTGECTNREHPHWGASNMPFARWLPAQYENDFSTPQGWEPERRYNGYKLPIVRKVSNDIMHTTNAHVTDDPDYSHLLVVWGQYIDHDISFTPQSLSTSTFQGLTDCKTTCMNQSPCYPMQVPSDDPRIQDAQCLPFFRSAAVCATGDTSSLFHKFQPREQINALTAFIDGSTVYGSDESLANKLRNLSTDDGLLRINEMFRDTGNREYLPFNPNNPCVQDPFDASGVPIPCFLAGDGRASEHLTLSAIHTLWVREHNRIARALKRMNPHWNGEVLYQEARKIIGAYHQVVNWKEYVPKIIGQQGVTMMGEYSNYNSSINPTVSNVFATAAFRFGHVTIMPEFRRLDENFNNHLTYPTILLHQAFFSPWRMIREGGIDPIMRGLIGRAAKLVTQTQMMHEELREKLFALQNKVALDLASLNLQRGRDHALPLYNDWREECGLPRVENFSALAAEISNQTVRDKLGSLYGHPGNIDIWLGGLMEDLLPGSRGGPTFTCLLSRQFKFLRDGDRFYYKNPGVFTQQQVAALDRMSFARVICDNTGVDRVQRDVFARASFPSDFVSCSDIPPLDLSLWQESPNVGNCGQPQNIRNGGWKKCGGGVSYFCNMGFRILGETDVECSGNQFSSSAPTCVDVNECENNNGGCGDVCENTMGSYTCSCSEGRRLIPDTKMCEDMPMQTPQSSPTPGQVRTKSRMIAKSPCNAFQVVSP